jgi:hypothetical protein
VIQFIVHRINKTEDLAAVDSRYGIEVDLRDNLNGNIHMEHDPFKQGTDFEEYCASYHHGTMILNIKSERIENRVLEILGKYNITDYFFLDSSFPAIHALSNNGNKNIALRFSEYEGIDTIRAMSGKVEWVWVDCFSRLPLNSAVYNELTALGYKVCIVSPELQQQPEKIEEYAELLLKEYIKPNAICTKVYNINKWKQLLDQF